MWLPVKSNNKVDGQIDRAIFMIFEKCKPHKNTLQRVIVNFWNNYLFSTNSTQHMSNFSVTADIWKKPQYIDASW